MKNVTKISSDEKFLEELNKTIAYFISKNEGGQLTNIEKEVLKKIEKIKDLSLGIQNLDMEQSKYGSLIRWMDEFGDYSYSKDGKNIIDLMYYFAYIYKMPPLL